MLKFNLIILSTLFVMNSHGAEFAKISATQLFHIKKIVLMASMQKSYEIVDPITKKAPNREIFLIADNKKKKLGWVRSIATDTGCRSACLPLNFSLMFDIKGEFLGYYSLDPLTKKNHRIYKESDTMSTEMILAADGPGLGPELVPMDLIDGVTMATRPEYDGKVVKDAALTTLRMLQYKRQTQQWIGRQKSN